VRGGAKARRQVKRRREERQDGFELELVRGDRCNNARKLGARGRRLGVPSGTDAAMLENVALSMVCAAGSSLSVRTARRARDRKRAIAARETFSGRSMPILRCALCSTTPRPWCEARNQLLKLTQACVASRISGTLPASLTFESS